jgi:hypothetical protein
MAAASGPVAVAIDDAPMARAANPDQKTVVEWARCVAVAGAAGELGMADAGEPRRFDRFALDGPEADYARRNFAKAVDAEIVRMMESRLREERNDADELARKLARCNEAAATGEFPEEPYGVVVMAPPPAPPAPGMTFPPLPAGVEARYALEYWNSIEGATALCERTAPAASARIRELRDTRRQQRRELLDLATRLFATAVSPRERAAWQAVEARRTGRIARNIAEGKSAEEMAAWCREEGPRQLANLLRDDDPEALAALRAALQVSSAKD